MELNVEQIAALIATDNFITAADTYKWGQWEHLRPGTKVTHANLVPRGAFVDEEHDIFLSELIALGPQVCAAVFAAVRVDDNMIDVAEVEITEQGYNFNRKGWEHIRDLGYLPLDIRAVPEGTILPAGLPMMTAQNTDGETALPSAWLPSYIETVAHDIIWKMSTICAKLRLLRQQVDGFCRATGVEDPNAGEYMVHNFGDRGAGGGAVLAGIAHAVYFSGSDSGRANRFIKSIYSVDGKTTDSIDAAEHSTMCSNSDCECKDDKGAFEMSLEMLQRAVDRAKRGVGIPVMSVPIDTFDDERFVGFVTADYKRICDIGGKYVMRPDSGVAVERPIDIVKFVRAGLRKTGVYGTVNGANFWSMPENLGVIQGDGLKLWDFPVLFQNAIKAKLSASNFAFGFGGGMTNGSGRDDFSFSMKATARMGADGVWISMQKDPKTDPKKKSLKGRVTVAQRDDGTLYHTPLDTVEKDFMHCICYNGTRPNVVTFSEVRVAARVAA